MGQKKKPDWRRMGEAARQRRAILGLTQQELVGQIDPPLNIDTVVKVEGGKRPNYRLTTLAAISRALDWPSDALWRIAQGEDVFGPEREAAIEERVTRLESAFGRLIETVDQLVAEKSAQPRTESQQAVGR